MDSGMINQTASIAADIPVDRAGSAQPRTLGLRAGRKLPLPKQCSEALSPGPFPGLPVPAHRNTTP